MFFIDGNYKVRSVIYLYICLSSINVSYIYLSIFYLSTVCLSLYRICISTYIYLPFHLYICLSMNLFINIPIEKNYSLLYIFIYECIYFLYNLYSSQRWEQRERTRETRYINESQITQSVHERPSTNGSQVTTRSDTWSLAVFWCCCFRGLCVSFPSTRDAFGRRSRTAGGGVRRGLVGVGDTGSVRTGS